MKIVTFMGVVLMNLATVAVGGINADTIDFNSLEWDADYKSENLVVYTAPVDGHSIKAFRAVSTYDASVNDMVNIVTDMKNFTLWMDGAEESWVAQKLDENTQACYFRNNAPFPLKDRDGVIVQKVLQQDENYVRIHLNLMNELVEEKSKFVRIDHLEGDWIIKKVGESKVELTYQIHLDPNGIVPNWAVNLMITDTPRKSLLNLHQQDLSRYASVVSDLL